MFHVSSVLLTIVLILVCPLNCMARVDGTSAPSGRKATWPCWCHGSSEQAPLPNSGPIAPQEESGGGNCLCHGAVVETTSTPVELSDVHSDPPDLAVGREIAFEQKQWQINGHFSAGGAAFESEIWCRLPDLQQSLKRQDVNGAPPQQLRQARDLTLRSGSWEQFQSLRDAGIVGRNVATRRGLKLGDQFSIGDLSIKVAGILSSPVPAERNLIYTSLEFLQYTHGLDAAGLVTQHEVYLTPNANPDEVAAAIDQTLRAGPVATTTRQKGAFQTSTLSDLVDLIGFAHWLGYACVSLVLSLVATTTVMSVQDRIKEHAVLQTLGLRPARVFRIVVAESLLLCFIGGIVGTMVALAILRFGGLAVAAEGVTIAFRPSLQLIVLGAVVSALVGLAASFIPAYHAARAPIVNSLRQA